MGGSINWFARNGVAANLLAVFILVAGVVGVISVKQEVFPEFALDAITVSVPYLGAAPQEVEEGVVMRIEEALQGLDGVKRITSNSSEGVGIVTVELYDDADARKVLDDVKTRVDAIDTFPDETEKPVITEVTNRRQVVNVAIYGETDEKSLRALAEQVRDDLAALPEISVVELSNARPYEISIEVSEATLRRHGLTFDQVANAIRRSSLDLPGGSVRTTGGEILLRTKGQAYRGREFERLVLLSRPDGTHLRLGDVANVVDGFAETDQSTRFDGKPAAMIEVFRIGQQDALGVADAVMRYLDEAGPRLPEGIELSVWNDASKVLRGRRDLLVRNGVMGLALVLVSLALFLRFRLSFWVAVGLCIAFMGTFSAMLLFDVSINMISLFAFILVLGIVVDDAIVVGENVYTTQHRTGQGLEGAIEGAQQVATPVVFAVLTTVAAFVPLLFVTGTIGKVMKVIPAVVIPCLLWSLVESVWILPAHLSHYKAGQDESHRAGWRRIQSLFGDGLDLFVRRVYRPVIEAALRWRYLTLAIGLGTLLLTAGLVISGSVGFVFFPDVEADYLSAAVTLPPGTPATETNKAVALLERSADELAAEVGEDVFVYRVGSIGEQPFRRAQQQNALGSAGREVYSHLGELTLELAPAEERSISSAELARRWREKTGQIPDAIELVYTSSLFAPGDDIDVELTGRDIESLRSAADQLKQTLGTYASVYEIRDSFREGKRELRLSIKPAAEVLGLTLSDLARQVRQAFYGEEAQRIQRGRDDVRVMVRYPATERRTVGTLETMRIRTPDGSEVPFSEVAELDGGRGYATIKRVDRRRAINVTADVDSDQIAPGVVIADLREGVLPALVQQYPGVRYSFEGQQKEQRETIGGLLRGFAIALVAIFGLLAIPLRSYLQPLLIMGAIPFGFVGAVWGHVMLGMDLTILSMFGLVALTGVVINDSLVMVDFINRQRAGGGPVATAVREAGQARFRAIMLTSLTTFAGLSPLMLERSMQARFLIPMAVSLAFGVLFATFITLVLVPASYIILDDIQSLPERWHRRAGRRADRDDAARAPRPAAAARQETESVGAPRTG